MAPSLETRSRLVIVARALLGLPYVYGSNTPRAGGLDCSGYVQWVLFVAGIEPWASRYPAKIDLTADGLWTALDPILGSPEPGDLAFYGAPGRASHVMLVLAVAGGVATEVIGASGGRPDVDTVFLAAQLDARVKIKPGANYRRDLLGFCRPALRPDTEDP